MSGLPGVGELPPRAWGEGLGAAVVIVLGWLGIQRRRRAGNGDARQYVTRDECLARHGGVDAQFGGVQTQLSRIETSVRDELGDMRRELHGEIAAVASLVSATREEMATGLAQLGRVFKRGER